MYLWICPDPISDGPLERWLREWTSCSEMVLPRGPKRRATKPRLHHGAGNAQSTDLSKINRPQKLWFYHVVSGNGYILVGFEQSSKQHNAV